MVKAFLKTWEHLQPQQISQAPRLQVGTILPVGKCVVFKVGNDLMTAAFQQWPDEPVAAACGHTGESALASTTKQPKEDLFSLIVSIMT